MSALVLDGHLKSALACVRSLGSGGVNVVCGAERSSALALYSKYVQKRFVYTSPKISPASFIQGVLSEAKKQMALTGEKPVVFCFSDATLLTLVREHESLKAYIDLPMPTRDAVEIASDKGKTYGLAQTLSIPTIQTYTVESFDQICFPAVVKNRHSIVWEKGKAVSGSATFVFSPEELLHHYQMVTQMTGEVPLVQECIFGDEYGVSMVCTHGKEIVTFVHKRIRSLNPKGGAAVVKETATDTEEVKLMCRYARALVEALNWHGPIMVEFKIDDKTGSVLLMEINGRFVGSLPLAVKAGINFPMLVYRLEEESTTAQTPQAFVPSYTRTRHFLGDVKWLLAVWFAKDRMRPILYPSRLRALYDFKKEIFLSKGDIFAWNDLKPAVMEYIDILKR
jgi:predicted ATP-grasp superfamily ATP-dependent carboligase